MTLARLFVIGLALVASAGPAAAGKPACPRELALAETSLLKTLVRMRSVPNVSQVEKCGTFRPFADVAAKARDVFDRCSTGRAREQDVGQMDGALDQVKTAIASSCMAQSSFSLAGANANWARFTGMSAPSNWLRIGFYLPCPQSQAAYAGA